MQHAMSEISLSIEETNRLRQSLGLKPLRTEVTVTDSNDPGQRQQSVQTSTPVNAKSQSELNAQLTHLRELRRAREATIGTAPLGKLDTEDTSVSHEDDLQRWVNSTRTREAKKSVDNFSNRSKQLVHPIKLPEEKHTLPAVPDHANEGTVLTLRDTLVIPKQSESHTNRLSSEEKLSGRDELEDVTMHDSGKSTAIPTAKYDPTDNAEFLKPPAPQDLKFDDVHSVARPEKLTVDSDYRVVPEERSVKFKRRERHSKKKRLRSRPTMSQTASQPEVSRGHVAKLRHDDDEKRNAEGATDEDDEDAHYTALLRARREKSKIESEKSISAILEAIRDTGDVDMKNDNEAVERGARLIFDEMQAFLQRVPGRIASSPSSKHQTGSSMDLSTPHSDINLEKTPANSNPNDETEINEKKNEAQQRVERIAKESPRIDVDDGNTNQDKVSAEPTGMTGIAATLKRLREMGQLTQKKLQSGRARDKRMNYGESESDEENESVKSARYRPHVKLAYVDDQGNELTPKEAFRLLCHKFHGNTPGKNKNEKRLKKILENMRLRNMRNDDTPLASVAAFKKESQKLGSAHVVLSGAEAFHGAETGHSDADGGKDGYHSGDENEKTQAGVYHTTMEQKVEFVIDKPGTKSVKRRRMQ